MRCKYSWPKQSLVAQLQLIILMSSTSSTNVHYACSRLQISLSQFEQSTNEQIDQMPLDLKMRQSIYETKKSCDLY